MIVKTVLSKGYVIISQEACVVTTPALSGGNYTVASLKESGGQAAFIAVSDFVEVSNEKSYVLPLPSEIITSGLQDNKCDNGEVSYYPKEWGTPKIFLSEDGAHLRLNLDDNDGPNLQFMGKLFSRATYASGSLGGVTDMSNAFESSNLQSLDLDFSKVVTIYRTFTGTKLESIDLTLPVCTAFYQAVQSCNLLKKARFILPICPTQNGLRGFAGNSIYAMSCIESIILHVPRVTKFDLSDNHLGDGQLTHLFFERDETGLSGLAACTTFKLGYDFRNLDAESIENIVDSLSDWSAEGTAATCQFPEGKLTEEQKAMLTAKGWTYTEV